MYRTWSIGEGMNWKERMPQASSRFLQQPLFHTLAFASHQLRGLPNSRMITKPCRENCRNQQESNEQFKRFWDKPSRSVSTRIVSLWATTHLQHRTTHSYLSLKCWFSANSPCLSRQRATYSADRRFARSLQGMSGHVLCQQQSTTCIWNPCWKLAHKCPIWISCIAWLVGRSPFSKLATGNFGKWIANASIGKAAHLRWMGGQLLTKHSILPILHRHLRRHLRAKGRILFRFLTAPATSRPGPPRVGCGGWIAGFPGTPYIPGRAPPGGFLRFLQLIHQQLRFSWQLER